MFRGSIVALVTPFAKDGSVDEKTLQDLVAFHIKSGSDGIVPCGTTGESATLDYDEHEKVIEVCIQAAKGKIPVIAGTGSNSTAEAVMMSRKAEKAGADGLLLVSPYYNKPTQKGLYLHFREIAGSVKIPIMLYNIASRTAVNIEPETIARLAADCKNIVAVKEASGSLDQMSRIIALCGDKFTVTSGDDSLTLPLMAIGGAGIEGRQGDGDGLCFGRHREGAAPALSACASGESDVYRDKPDPCENGNGAFGHVRAVLAAADVRDGTGEHGKAENCPEGIRAFEIVGEALSESNQAWRKRGHGEDGAEDS